MRGFFSLIAEVIAIVIIAALAIFAVENVLTVHVSLLGRGFTANLWWLVVGAALLGFILAWLLMAPLRAAAFGRPQRPVSPQPGHAWPQGPTAPTA